MKARKEERPGRDNDYLRSLKSRGLSIYDVLLPIGYFIENSEQLANAGLPPPFVSASAAAAPTAPLRRRTAALSSIPNHHFSADTSATVIRLPLNP